MTANQFIGVLHVACPVIVALVFVVRVILPLAACFKGLGAILLIVFAFTVITKALTTATHVVHDIKE